MHDSTYSSYVLLKGRLGSGQFGDVFKARRLGTGQLVALKYVSTKNKTPEELKAMRREMDITKKLGRHEGIVFIHEVLHEEDKVVIVQELARTDLSKIILQDLRLPEEKVQFIAHQLVGALHFLHSNRVCVCSQFLLTLVQVLHRDLKPQNILLTHGERIKLCDFGFARSMSPKTMMVSRYVCSGKMYILSL